MPLEGEEMAILGLDLPEAVEELLERASMAYSRPEEAAPLLRQATRLAPEHPAVMIASYRFFFYRGMLAEAQDVAELCLSKAAWEIGRPGPWEEMRPDDADFSDWGAVVPRFFLFSLKGWAYLRMRQGDLASGRLAVEKLLELDPLDRIGAGTLLGVLERGGRDDDG
jgi:tetratricopeptide (TPR) repeat protein